MYIFELAPTLPAPQPDKIDEVEIRDVINDQSIEDNCLSYRHDYGLMSEGDKETLRFEYTEWVRAMINNGLAKAIAKRINGGNE